MVENVHILEGAKGGNSHMKCPHCGRELIPGMISEVGLGTNGTPAIIERIFFTDDEIKKDVLKRKGIKVGISDQAAYCENCNMVFSEYKI